jgi:hypothetical protein
MLSREEVLKSGIWKHSSRGTPYGAPALPRHDGTPTVLTRIISLLAAALVASACHPSRDDRVFVSNSDPGIACSPTERPRSSRDAASAIAHAKGAFASVYEKTHSIEASPTNIAKFEPYTAVLKDGVWHVQGTAPAGYYGDIPVASVCKNDEGASVTWLKVPPIVG